MRKFITIVVLVFLSVFSYGQTSVESEMITEINEIRKDPKSYIPKVESYIKTQEKFISFLDSPNVTSSTKSTEMKSDKNNNLVPTGKVTSGGSIFTKRITAAKELIKVLESTKPLDTLVFDSTVYKVTKSHGEYLTSIGKVGHYDKDGNRPYVRFKNIGNVSENVAGTDSKTLLRLMLDVGVPNRGHRTNILDPNVKYVAIHIDVYCTVQNFME